MGNQRQEAIRILKLKSQGLEETFIGASSDFELSEDDEEYAVNACREILEAINVIRGK